jgi:hypothetical protein
LCVERLCPARSSRSSVYDTENSVVSLSEFKRSGISSVMICSIAVVHTLIWAVSTLYVAGGFAVWVLGGHVITVDDDLPGGWNNLDGTARLPSMELEIKAAVLFALVGLVFLTLPFRTRGGCPRLIPAMGC